MSRLVVTAEASPLFDDFLMVVSVSSADDGLPTKGLKKANFTIAQLASLNHASANVRTVKSVKEGPPGFYIVQLQPPENKLFAGHYVLGVIVTAGPRDAPSFGQTVASGDIP